ncbi:MAG TPA: AAA family ATPase [Candidatus Dormibacteraeota bacterium]|nr:AAA family ATPase [Candidatus Dormibacteraeota bacterium]
MKLTGVRVRRFRNIIDSNPIAVQGDVTCLVGKNESGKTAILEALYRLKPIYPAEFRDIDDYPRWMLADHRRSGEIEKTFPVEATFELEPADVDAIEAVGGKGIVKAAETLIVQKDYANKSHVSLPSINERVTVTRLLETAKLPDGLRGIVGEPATVADLAARLGEIEHAVPKIDKPTEQAVAKLEEAIKSQFPEGVVQALESLILQRMPSFLYFSEYSQLQGKVDLEHLFDATELDPSQLTARSLLRLAHADNESILALDYEERRSELEAAANRLTQEVARYWSQSSELKVDIDVEMAAGGSGQIAKYLQIRVEDLRHGFSNRFDQRSSGFRWFFSFLAAFHEFEKQKDRVVILLDEPALELHPRAQRDFLRFINERLAPKHQVFYTTHSPFMIEADHLERVRMVEDKGRGVGAVVSADVLSAEPDSFFPLQAALGYDIAQSVFSRPDNLLVEDTSDYTYLTVISDHLKQFGREHLNGRWQILPAGGLGNIPAVVALIGRQMGVTVLVESKGGSEKLVELAKAGFLKPKRLVAVAEVTGAARADVEDLFEVDDYLALYNQAFGKSLRAADLPPGERILDRIKEKEGDFDAGRPADALLRLRDKLLPPLRATTRARFEDLFRRINKTL